MIIFKNIKTRITACVAGWVVILSVTFVFLHAVDEVFVTWREIFIETAAAITPLLLFANYFYRHVVKPTEDLAGAMRDVSHGIQPGPVSIARDDEIGLIIKEFNTMTQALHQRDALLREMNKRLQARNTELIAMNERLTEADRAKTEFLANVTHELKTPLSTIRGYSEMVLQGVGGEPSETHRDFAEETLASSLHLLEMVNDILDFSKAASGRMEMKFEKFSLSELVNDVEVAVRPMLQKKGHSFDVVPAPGIEYVTADRLRIKQVILNLLSNAIKFTPQGGSISVGSFARGGHWGLFVTDTGIGIKEEDFSRIFIPFSQLDSSYTRKYEGTGLGLAICQRIVGMHGGRIWVESRPGKGSSFYFSIPDNLKEAGVSA